MKTEQSPVRMQTENGMTKYNNGTDLNLFNSDATTTLLQDC